MPDVRYGSVWPAKNWAIPIPWFARAQPFAPVDGFKGTSIPIPMKHFLKSRSTGIHAQVTRVLEKGKIKLHRLKYNVENTVERLNESTLPSVAAVRLGENLRVGRVVE